MYQPPEKNCQLCPRLVAFRRENTDKFPDQFNGAVPSFGALEATLLVVGLAPGLKGANFSGRPFTGDYAGDILYPALLKHGLAKGEFGAHKDDGLELVGTRITNAVRCVPPQNKPVGQEMTMCRDFLKDEIAHMPNLKAILSLGRIAHEAVVKCFGQKPKDFVFKHSAKHQIAPNIKLFNTYHTSRYNVNTRRLTVEMFDEIIAQLKKSLS